MSGPSHVTNKMHDPHRWDIAGTMNVTGVLNASGTVNIQGRADGATITLGTPAANARTVTVQLNDAIGTAVASAQTVKLHVFADAGGLAYATTGGSTGIADAGAGAILAVVAKKLFSARSNATGLIELTWTDTASEVAFLGVELPSGRTVFSAALTI